MTIDYAAHLRSDGEKMTSAVARDLDAHVPTCPEWNVAKLTIHMGQHHRWVADAVRKGGAPPDTSAKPGLRDGALVEWFREGWSDLADLLDATDDDAPAWSWANDNRAGFWKRRTALETTVHRWDAENATGQGSALDAALAADGIDEMFFVMIPHMDVGYHGASIRVGVRPSDVRRAWTLDLRDGDPSRPSRDEDGELPPAPDVTLTGTAEDLLLFIWGRRSVDAVKVGGDADEVNAFVRWIVD